MLKSSCSGGISLILLQPRLAQIGTVLSWLVVLLAVSHAWTCAEESLGITSHDA